MFIDQNLCICLVIFWRHASVAAPVAAPIFRIDRALHRNLFLSFQELGFSSSVIKVISTCLELLSFINSWAQLINVVIAF